MFKDGVDVSKLLHMGNSVKSIANAISLMKKINNSLMPNGFKGGWGQKSDMWEKALDASK